MQVRRVVTGHDANGKSVFASDESVEPITSPLMPGLAFHRLWGGDGVPTFPDGGAMPEHRSYFPSVNGFRFAFFTLPPSEGVSLPADLDIAATVAELEAKLPGMMDHMEPDAPGMHTTDTIDFEVVLSGRVILELDDGAERELGPGDTVVQNGTRHRWRNPGTEPAVMAVCMLGANRG